MDLTGNPVPRHVGPRGKLVSGSPNSISGSKETVDCGHPIIAPVNTRPVQNLQDRWSTILRNLRENPAE